MLTAMHVDNIIQYFKVIPLLKHCDDIPSWSHYHYVKLHLSTRYLASIPEVPQILPWRSNALQSLAPTLIKHGQANQGLHDH